MWEWCDFGSEYQNSLFKTNGCDLKFLRNDLHWEQAIGVAGVLGKLMKIKERKMSNIVRHDPFDDFFRGFFVRPVEFGSPLEAPSIKMDVREVGENFVVHADLPGMKKEDIHVSIEGPMVVISAERKSEQEVKEGERVLRTERHFGKVSRSFQLGQDIDESKASAKFADGVLELLLPKKAVTAGRRLNIE